jgi:DNA-binding transcriptional MocR family regulator
VPEVVPAGGFHLWLPLPERVDDQELTVAAAAERVVVFPGWPWYAGEPPRPHVRLSFAAAPPDALAEGVRRLARTLAAT